MTPRLRQDALAGVDQDDREIGRRCAGGHVPRVLLVAGRIGHDELALFRREEAIGDIDGDALFAFRRQPVDQKGEVQLVALRSHLLRIGFQRRQLVLEDQLGFIEKPPDQGRLAVIHAAAGNETQQRFLFLGLEIAVDIGSDEVGLMCHQK